MTLKNMRNVKWQDKMQETFNRKKAEMPAVNNKWQEMREKLNYKDKYGKCYLAEKMWETLNGKTKNAGNDKCQEKI